MVTHVGIQHLNLARHNLASRLSLPLCFISSHCSVSEIILHAHELLPPGTLSQMLLNLDWTIGREPQVKK